MILEKVPEQQRDIKAVRCEKREQLRKRKNSAQDRGDEINPLHKAPPEMKERENGKYESFLFSEPFKAKHYLWLLPIAVHQQGLAGVRRFSYS